MIVKDVCSTVRNKGGQADAIQRSYALLGLESSAKFDEKEFLNSYDVEFVDYPFTKSDYGFKDYLKDIKKIDEYNDIKYIVAPDIMNEEDFDKSINQADKLLEFSEDVIIVPKVVNPINVPNRFIVGYPNQEKWGKGSKYGILEFQQADKVHILGGGAFSILEKAKYLDPVSFDTSSVGTGASFGDVWRSDGWEDEPSISYYERIEVSLNNLSMFFDSVEASELKNYVPEPRHPRDRSKIKCVICGYKWDESENIWRTEEVAEPKYLTDYKCPNCKTLNTREILI